MDAGICQNILKHISNRCLGIGMYCRVINPRPTLMAEQPYTNSYQRKIRDKKGFIRCQ